MEAILPIIESGPWVDKISFKIIREDDEDIGLKIAMGKISLGKRLVLISDIKSFKRLLLVKTVTEMIMANIPGKIESEMSNPSLTPSRNSS